MDVFPFSPERLARLSALAARINGTRGPAPLPEPVLLNDRGDALLPVPGSALGEQVWAKVCAGVILQWTPASEAPGAIVSLWGGPPDETGTVGLNYEGFATFLTPTGLRAFAADLRAIADQLDGGAA